MGKWWGVEWWKIWENGDKWKRRYDEIFVEWDRNKDGDWICWLIECFIL